MNPPTLRQTNAFSRQLQSLKSETYFQELAARLKTHPTLGDVIPGTGGLRKIRMAIPGRGSRGGARLIYLWAKEAGELFFLWIYSKGESEDLSAKEKKALSGVAREIKLQSKDAKKKAKGGGSARGG